tara:strand:- start:147 stop:1070 length:924 start_codon:yes stop_codon:yes gene_type:complete
MYQKGLLLNIFNKILGSYIESKNDDVAFFCPFCHHHKKKFSINLKNQKWHCWVCNAKGRKLIHLLRKLNSSNEIIKQVLDIVGEYGSFKNDKSIETEYNIQLPKYFRPLWIESSDLTYKHALKYINSRNITNRDIIRYGIGYCSDGRYVNRVIIPSYDCDGKLNYFIARDIFPNSKFKYKNPNIPKDTIIFEIFINWNKPIILCEGVFDAITIKRNSIPLLGKFPSKTLVKKIIYTKVKEIYIALDEDAKKDSIKLSNFLMNYGIKTYRIGLKKKDPSELGFINFWKLLNNTNKYSFSQSIKDRLYD